MPKWTKKDQDRMEILIKMDGYELDYDDALEAYHKGIISKRELKEYVSTYGDWDMFKYEHDV